MKSKNEDARPSGAAEGARSATGAAPDGRGERGRFTSIRKMEAALRLLRGEALDTLSRELSVAASTLSGWKEAFLAAGQAGLKSRDQDARDEEIARLKQLLGDREMRLEIHRQAERLRAGELLFVRGRRK